VDFATSNTAATTELYVSTKEADNRWSTRKSEGSGIHPIFSPMESGSAREGLTRSFEFRSPAARP
jgi:hypothetical protein